MGQFYYRSLGGKDPRVLRAIFLCHGGKIKDGDMPAGVSLSTVDGYVSSDRAKQYLFGQFGVDYKGSRIPPEAYGKFEVEGYTFLLRSSTNSNVRNGITAGEDRRGRFSSRAHRLFIDCPVCDHQNWIPVGRFWQHAIIHNKAPGANTFPPSTIPEESEEDI